MKISLMSISFEGKIKNDEAAAAQNASSYQRQRVRPSSQPAGLLGESGIIAPRSG